MRYLETLGYNFLERKGEIMSDEDYCEGCAINEICNEENYGDCPCTNCLVKMMCDDEGCDMWIKWDKEVAKRRNYE
jgi:hypothetical protein